MQPPASTETKVDPPGLTKIRERVKELIPDSTESWDRRGFRLLEWPAPGEVKEPGGKPIQLSLEHEARLRPADDAATGRLLVTLLSSERRRLGDCFQLTDSEFAEMTVRQYVRDPGPQSMDRYFDLDSALTLTERGISVRQRLKGSKFMSWNVEGGLRPLNAELPVVDVGPPAGMIARYEFNWIADIDAGIEQALGSADSDRQRNPLWLIGELTGITMRPLVPVIDHITVRAKFGIHEPVTPDESSKDPKAVGAERFAINVDLVRTSSTQDPSRTGQYVDVDISSESPIDVNEFDRLTRFTGALCERFDLIPGEHTKNLRDAKTLGLLG